MTINQADVIFRIYHRTEDTTMNTATDIKNIVKKQNFDFFGLRVINDYFGAAPVAVGDTLEPSYRWEDGEPTDDELYGTCALAVDADSDIDRALGALLETYRCIGNQVVLIGGHQAEWGEDAGEIVIRDAKVLYAENI